MKIVLGLGNAGARYRWTRHNLGFRVVDVVASRHEGRFLAEAALGEVAWTCEIDLDPYKVVLAKPRTWMNLSGRAGSQLCQHYDVAPEDLIVVHDDADLALGRVRIRSAGRAGGHNGVRSLIGCLRTEAFPRVKLGIRGQGREGAALVDYVLEDFEAEERPIVEEMIQVGADAVEVVVRKDLRSAMEAYNGRAALPREGSDR